jgi:hypothetical protein
MLIVISALLLLLIFVVIQATWTIEKRLHTLTQLASSVRPVDPATTAHRVDAVAKSEWEMDWAEEGSLGAAARSVVSDLRIIKRRAAYLHLMCTDLRTIKAYIEQKWSVSCDYLTSDPGLAHDRLEGLRHAERQMPLSDDLQHEKDMLEKFVRDWRASADKDEFDAALGDRR